MTPARFLLILAVIVLALFGISLAVSQRQSGQRADPGQSQFAKINPWFASRQKLDVFKDLRSDCLQGTRLVIPQVRMECKVKVLPSDPVQVSDRSIRKAELWLTGPDTFRVRYQPSPSDKGAVALNIEELKKPLRLVFLKHGGELTLTRKSTQGAATIDIR